MKIRIQIVVLAGLLLASLVACNKTNNTPEEANVPVIGHSFVVNFGEYVFKLDFKSETEMTYTSLKGSTTGTSETVQITRKEIRPNVFMVYWQEQDKTTVTHVEDFSKGVVYTNITHPDNTFTNLGGTLVPVK
jgi:hypothetical protein